MRVLRIFYYLFESENPLHSTVLTDDFFFKRNNWARKTSEVYFFNVDSWIRARFK